MAYCRNCGSALVDGAKFCQICGIATNLSPLQSAGRQHEFAGKIYKCPNCGEILQSFVRNCPSCGLELRSIRATNSVREFALKLEAIESRREYEEPRRFFSGSSDAERIPKADEQKISLIQSFTVPNTKEDMLEFMILATSNIDTSLFGIMDDRGCKARKAVAKAWLSKIIQVYEKAKNSYGDKEDFQRIGELYQTCIDDVRKQKKKRVIKWTLAVGWLPLFYIALFTFIPIAIWHGNAKEEARLESIVNDVQEALDEDNYRLALRTAESMEYSGSDDERERWWGIQKEELIVTVLEEASKNGIYLERASTATNAPTADIAPEPTSDGFNLLGAFSRGFKEGFSNAMDETSE